MTPPTVFARVKNVLDNAIASAEHLVEPLLSPTVAQKKVKTLPPRVDSKKVKELA
jgi:hypothetical protein